MSNLVRSANPGHKPLPVRTERESIARSGDHRRIERLWCSHRSDITRAAEVFRKISQNFYPAGVRSPFVARAMPMDANSVVPVTRR
jgi:hypothetical protein